MAAKTRHTPRPVRKGAKRAKTLISTAALAVTFGGWIAMANSDGTPSLSYDSSLLTISSLQAASQAATQSGTAGSRVDGAPVPASQPPIPITMTHSSR